MDLKKMVSRAKDAGKDMQSKIMAGANEAKNRLGDDGMPGTSIFSGKRKLAYACGGILALIILVAIFFLGDPHKDIKGIWYCDDLAYIDIDTGNMVLRSGFHDGESSKSPVGATKFTVVSKEKTDKGEQYFLSLDNGNQLNLIFRDGKVFMPGFFATSECARHFVPKKKRRIF